MQLNGKMRQDGNDKGYIMYYKNSGMFLRRLRYDTGRQLFLNRAIAMSPQIRKSYKKHSQVKKIKVQYIQQFLHKDRLTELINKKLLFSLTSYDVF
jgi:hypothetical protein